MVPTPLNVHRLLITGVLLAAKLMDDNYFNNAYYAKVSFISCLCWFCDATPCAGYCTTCVQLRPKSFL